jgi:sn-glycerol 3-phosphate transport system substrate-binding protein
MVRQGLGANRKVKKTRRVASPSGLLIRALPRAVLLGLLVGLGACAAPPSLAPNEPTQFQFWYAFTGAPSEATIEIAQRFNAAQTRCRVELLPHDIADELFTRVKAGLRSKELPALVHIPYVATQTFLDWQIAEPLETFITRDRFDGRDLDARALAAYTFDGKLYGMPYNITTAILYYNQDAFRSAGLEPQQPPRTLAQVTAAARRLTSQDARGLVTRYGFAMAIYGWFFEQLLAVSGDWYFDNENGRAAPATRARFNSPAGVAILTWWKEGFDAGVFGNLGRPTSETQKAFDAQNVAMMIDSTAVLPARLDAARGKFHIGVAPLPRPDDAPPTAGALLGGAALYILKDRPMAEQTCAWQFIQFFVTPEIQTYWHITSGSLALMPKVYAYPTSQEYLARYPQFRIAIEQVETTPNHRITQGATSGVLPAARLRVERAIEEVLQGKATPQDALDRAAAEVTQLMKDYAQTIPRR